jgi:hypothetical protein
MRQGGRHARPASAVVPRSADRNWIGTRRAALSPTRHRHRVARYGGPAAQRPGVAAAAPSCASEVRRPARRAPDGHYRIAVVQILRELIGDHREQQPMLARWGQLQYPVAAGLQHAQHVGQRRSAHRVRRIDQYVGHQRHPPAAQIAAHGAAESSPCADPTGSAHGYPGTVPGHAASQPHRSAPCPVPSPWPARAAGRGAPAQPPTPRSTRPGAARSPSHLRAGWAARPTRACWK